MIENDKIVRNGGIDVNANKNTGGVRRGVRNSINPKTEWNKWFNHFLSICDMLAELIIQKLISLRPEKY